MSCQRLDKLSEVISNIDDDIRSIRSELISNGDEINATTMEEKKGDKDKSVSQKADISWPEVIGFVPAKSCICHDVYLLTDFFLQYRGNICSIYEQFVRKLQTDLHKHRIRSSYLMNGRRRYSVDSSFLEIYTNIQIKCYFVTHFLVFMEQNPVHTFLQIVFPVQRCLRFSSTIR